ncbi:TPA: hypothetical protein ACM5LL_004476, partial [Escherichia coli]
FVFISSTSKYWQPELEASSRALMKRLQQLLKSRNYPVRRNVAGALSLVALVAGKRKPPHVER